jgi:hypothetical protein
MLTQFEGSKVGALHVPGTRPPTFYRRPSASERRPVCSALERPDAVPLPTTSTPATIPCLFRMKGHFPNVVERQALTDFEDRIAPVELRPAGRKSIKRSWRHHARLNHRQSSDCRYNSHRLANHETFSLLPKTEARDKWSSRCFPKLLIFHS